MALPVVRVTLKAAKALRRMSPWCYRTEVMESPTLPRGAIVEVQDPQQNVVGQAFWAQKSPLALRLLTRRPADEERVDDAFFFKRLQSALKRRESLAPRDAFRICHGESDLLPGLLVDRYGQALCLQTLSEGADVRKELFSRQLAELTGAAQVVCRDDHSGRDFEQLPREKKLLFGQGASRFRYHEGQNAFEADLFGDMKTGAFLDQVDNHLRAGELGRGEALDCFSYHGGFALALAQNCQSVLAVDQDETAAARAKTNAEVNGRTNVEVLHANAFDVLHKFEKEGRRFDTVVVDPPAFAKRKEGVKTALRAYHELNLRALKCLRPDGLLVSCSCSGKVSRDAFEQMILDAAADAKRAVQILERRGAGIDHPVLGTMPESEYLKAYFVRAL